MALPSNYARGKVSAKWHKHSDSNKHTGEEKVANFDLNLVFSNFQDIKCTYSNKGLQGRKKFPKRINLEGYLFGSAEYFRLILIKVTYFYNTYVFWKKP